MLTTRHGVLDPSNLNSDFMLAQNNNEIHFNLVDWLLGLFVSC